MSEGTSSVGGIFWKRVRRYLLEAEDGMETGWGCTQNNRTGFPRCTGPLRCTAMIGHAWMRIVYYIYSICSCMAIYHMLNSMHDALHRVMHHSKKFMLLKLLMWDQYEVLEKKVITSIVIDEDIVYNFFFDMFLKNLK